MQYNADFLILYNLITILARKKNKFVPDIESTYNLAKTEYHNKQHWLAVSCPPSVGYWEFYLADKCTQISKLLG